MINLECEIDGETYPVNTQFVDKKCSGYCKCESDGFNIGYSCVSLCPPMGVMCLPGQKLVAVKEPIPGSNCTCDRNACVDGMSILLLQLIQTGFRWYDFDCLNHR